MTSIQRHAHQEKASRPAPSPADPTTGTYQGTQAQQLLKLAHDLELFHSPDDRGYATVRTQRHKETWAIRSSGFRKWLVQEFYRAHDHPPNASALTEALETLDAQAQFDRPEQSVFLRVAEADGAIYLDLANERWEAVKITADGWHVVAGPPVRFHRSRGMKALPYPARGGTLRDLNPFINVVGLDRVLLRAWLVAALRPRGPYPILVVTGEQGSTKSTLARVVSSLIDPRTPSLRAHPRREQDLMIAASHVWCVSFDNLSYVPPWLSDACCRVATGGGYGTRELYSDEDEVLFDVMRPVVLNGITELVTRPDLLDRSLMISLRELPDEHRRTEEEFWRDFEAIRPRVLGALLDAVSMALRRSHEVELPTLPRMADFARWATAAELALNCKPGAFRRAYERNRSAANQLALEASPVATALLDFVRLQKTWEGTAVDLLVILSGCADERTQRQRCGWPQSPRGLSQALRRLAPPLRAQGVTVAFRRQPGDDRTRLISISGEAAKP